MDFSVTATDPDGDELSMVWTVNGRPAQSGLPDFRFRTDHSSNGTYEVVITVSDSYWTVHRTWRLEVRDVNRPPVIEWSPERDMTVNETEKVSFWAVVSDPDGDPVGVNWSLDGVSVSSQTSWEYITDHNSSGTHNVTVRASDGRDTASHSWTVTVANLNRPPRIMWALPAPTAIIRAVEGRPVTFAVEASDPDADPLTYRWSINGRVVQGEANSTFACVRGLSVGSNTVTAEVSDGGATVLQRWELAVSAAPEDREASALPGMALASALLIILILGLAAIFVMMRKRGAR